MTKINNLFFFYVLSCIGFGVGSVYWDKDYARYIFMGISMLIGLFMFFSKYFYTKESHDFFESRCSLHHLFPSFVSLFTAIEMPIKL